MSRPKSALFTRLTHCNIPCGCLLRQIMTCYDKQRPIAELGNIALPHCKMHGWARYRNISTNILYHQKPQSQISVSIFCRSDVNLRKNFSVATTVFLRERACAQKGPLIFAYSACTYARTARTAFTSCVFSFTQLLFELSVLLLHDFPRVERPFQFYFTL